MLYNEASFLIIYLLTKLCFLLVCPDASTIQVRHGNALHDD